MVLSGAEGELNPSTEQGAEKALSQGADQGSQRTDEVGQGEAEEKWVDLDPNQYAEPIRVEVEKLNKAARSQFHKTVSRLSTEGKTAKQEADQLKSLLRAAAADPREFENWHKSQFPEHEYWKQKSAPQISQDDKQALETLRKAGIITKDDLTQILGPLVQKLHATETAAQERMKSEAKSEIDAQAKHCAEKKVPWNDEIGFACIELIRRKKADTIAGAYDLIYKPMLEKTAQLDLASKKLASQTTQHSKTGEHVTGGQALRDIITNVVRGG